MKDGFGYELYNEKSEGLPQAECKAILFESQKTTSRVICMRLSLRPSGHSVGQGKRISIQHDDVEKDTFGDWKVGLAADFCA